MYNEMEYQEEYRMADLIRRQWLGIITAEEQAELEAWSLQEEHARLYAKIRNQTELQKRNLYVDGLDVDGVWHKLREQIADVPVRNTEYSDDRHLLGLCGTVQPTPDHRREYD